MHPRYFNPNFKVGGAQSVNKDGKLREEIVKFFKENPYPSDSQVHALAKRLGVNKHKFEEVIYGMLTELLQ